MLHKSDINFINAFELLQMALNKIQEMHNKSKDVFGEAKQIMTVWGVNPIFN